MAFAPGARPTQEGAKQVRTALAALGAIQENNARLKALHKQYGASLPGTTGAKAINQALTANRIEGKNIAQLGALSESDAQIMRELVGADPASFEGNLRTFFGADNTEQALDAFQQWAQDRLSAQAKANNYAPTAAPGLQSTAGKVAMRGPNGEEGFLDVSEVEEAKSNGWSLR